MLASIGSPPACAPEAGQFVAPTAPESGAPWMKLLTDHVLYLRARKAWSRQYYDDVFQFIAKRAPDLQQPLRIVEVGTAFGGLANYLLQRLPRAQLYAVDPFLSGYDPSDRHAHTMAAIASKLWLNKTELSVAWASGMAYDLTARHGSCRYRLFHMTRRKTRRPSSEQPSLKPPSTSPSSTACTPTRAPRPTPRPTGLWWPQGACYSSTTMAALVRLPA
mmetsp:Transcript_51129/g.165138  ORF Transcript_51129/g.165138 Transcript_51129/m.165138 type:complete len:219 (-) Transcript_51129:162-818(-)